MATILTAILSIGLLQAVNLAALAGRAKLIATMFGPEGIGVVGIVDQIVIAVLSLFVFSLTASSTLFLSRSFALGAEDFQRTHRAFLIALVLSSLVGTTITLTLFGAGWVGETLLRYRALAMVAVLAVPALAMGTFGASTLAAARQSRRSVLVPVSTACGMFCAAVVGLPLGGLQGLYWASVAVSLVVAALVLRHVRRALGLLRSFWIDPRSALARHPSLLFVCSSNLLLSVALPVTWLIARTAVLQGFGEARAGLLHALIALAVGFGMLLRPVSPQLLLPLVSGSQTNEQKFRDTYGVQRRLVVGLGLLALPIVLFSRWLLIVLYSRAFADVAPYLHLFLVAETLLLLGGTLKALLLGLGDTRTWAASYAIGFTCFGALAWTLGRHYEIPGIAAAVLVGNTLLLLVPLARLCLAHGFRPPGRLYAITLVVLLMIPTAGLLTTRYDDGSALALLVKLAAGAVIAAGLLVALEREDRAVVRRVLRRGVGR